MSKALQISKVSLFLQSKYFLTKYKMEFRIDKIDGIDEFLRRIGELSVQKVINGSIKKSIFSVENQSKRETPVDTGILRNSYETKFENLEGRLRNFREYGFYVHE